MTTTVRNQDSTPNIMLKTSKESTDMDIFRLRIKMGSQLEKLIREKDP